VDSAPYRAGAGPWTVVSRLKNGRWRLGKDEPFEAPGKQARIAFGIHEVG